MNRRRFLLSLALLLPALLLFSGRPSLAGPDDDLKKARKALKKNAKNLQKVVEALDRTLETLRTTPIKMEDKRRELSEQIDQLRSQGLDLIEKVRQADNDEAAEFLTLFAVDVHDDDLFRRSKDELFRLQDESAIGWLAETLEGELGEGKKRRRGAGPDAWKAQVLAAEILGGLNVEPAVPALALVIEKGTHPAVVNACVAAAARKEDKRVIAALIERLKQFEKQGGWEYFNVRNALTQLTGQDFFTHERWSAWWTAEEGAWDFKGKGEAKEATMTRERGPEEKVPTFFGSEIASNRVVFVIDTSGSMQMTDRPSDSDLSEEDFRKADPDSDPIKQFQRIERAKRELQRAIEALQPSQRFNVVSYSSGVRRWQERVVPANDVNRKEAIAWVGGLRADGGTYTDDALKEAFQDPDMDTIYLLSDGAPFKKVGNPGESKDKDNPIAGEQQIQFAQEMIEEILGYVRYENRFRGVKIYTFGMDGPGVWHRKWTQPRPLTLPTDSRWLSVLSGFMRDLAALTGGDFKSI